MHPDTMRAARAPLQPQKTDIPLAEVPSSVTVTAADADVSLAIWDYFMSDGDTDYSGLLNATPVE